MRDVFVRAQRKSCAHQVTMETNTTKQTNVGRSCSQFSLTCMISETGHSDWLLLFLNHLVPMLTNGRGKILTEPQRESALQCPSKTFEISPMGVGESEAPKLYKEVSTQRSFVSIFNFPCVGIFHWAIIRWKLSTGSFDWGRGGGGGGLTLQQYAICYL